MNKRDKIEYIHGINLCNGSVIGLLALNNDGNEVTLIERSIKFKSYIADDESVYREDK